MKLKKHKHHTRPKKSIHTIFLSIINEGQSNVIGGGGEASPVELRIEFKPGNIASFHNGRVVQGIVNDGQRTFPFLLDGIFICIWLQICSSYDDGYFELSGEFISTFRSMSVILVKLDSCRRYLAVDNPAIPPPRIIMCSLLLLFCSSSVLNFLITPRRIGECSKADNAMAPPRLREYIIQIMNRGFSQEMYGFVQLIYRYELPPCVSQIMSSNLLCRLIANSLNSIITYVQYNNKYLVQRFSLGHTIHQPLIQVSIGSVHFFLVFGNFNI